MMICPNCGNSYDDTGKYCPCCGNASGTSALSEPAPSELVQSELVQSEPLQPELHLYAGVVSQQPIWVTQSSNQPLNGPLDESFLEVPGIDDISVQQHTLQDILKSSTSYNDSAGTDIFDDVADSASAMFSMMSPKMKRFMISIIVGSLLSLIPIIYVACSSNSGSTAGSVSRVTTSNILLPD